MYIIFNIYDMTKIYTNSTGNILTNSTGNILQSVYKISNIPDMVLWLEPSAKNITIEDDRISKWNDISGKSNHAIQSNINNRPYYIENILNGYNGIDFTNNDYLKSQLYLNNFTIFTIFNSTNNQYIYEYGDDSTNSTGFYLKGDVSTILTNKNNIRSSKKYLSNWGISTSLKMVTHYYNGNHSGHLLKINGTNVSLGNDLIGNPGNLDTTKYINIGGKSSGSGINGQILEYIIYNRTLNSNEMSIVENYLKIKYSI